VFHCFLIVSLIAIKRTRLQLVIFLVTMKRLREDVSRNKTEKQEEDNSELALVPDLIRLVLVDYIAPLWLAQIRRATKPEVMRAGIRRYRDLFLRPYPWLLLTEKERVVHQTRLLSAGFSVTMMSMLIDPLLRLIPDEKACLRQWKTTTDLGMPLSGTKPTSAFQCTDFWIAVGQALEQYLPRVSRYILNCACGSWGTASSAFSKSRDICTPTWCNRGGKMLALFKPVPEALETPAFVFVDFACPVFGHQELCRPFIESFHQPHKLSFLIFPNWLSTRSNQDDWCRIDFSIPAGERSHL